MYLLLFSQILFIADRIDPAVGFLFGLFDHVDIGHGAGVDRNPKATTSVQNNNTIPLRAATLVAPRRSITNPLAAAPSIIAI